MGLHVFHPEPLSDLPPHPIPLGHPSNNPISNDNTLPRPRESGEPTG